MIQFITGAGTALVSALISAGVSWSVAAASKRREDAKEARATVRAQADALIVAVAELRGMANTNKVLWDRWAERGRTLLLFLAAGLGGYAHTLALARRDDRADREWLARTAGLGAAADMLGRDRREAKRLGASLPPVMVRIWAAAAPLLRHPDQRVTVATERLLAAVSDIEATEALDTALQEFGRAVVPATTAPPTWWRRLRPARDRSALAGPDDGKA